MLDRRAIFLRAWQLKRWNGRETFAWALRFAWAEAKSGTLPSFAPAAVAARRVEAVRREIACLENRTRMSPAGYSTLRSLRIELGLAA